MATRLSKLRINEVSSVDRGAGEGVQILLMKRAGAADPLPAEVEAYLKRDFSDAERQRLAGSGAAMPGGGYPIENVGDLKNAIRAFGRAKDKAKTKAHIIARARSLGATSELPDDWKVGKSADTLALATTALIESVASIRGDETVANKAELIAEQVADFKKFLDGVAPAEAIDALAASLAGGASALQKESTMTDDEKKAAEAKAKKEAEDKEKAEKAMRDENVALKRENAVLKMSGKHKDYMDAAEMSDAEKEKFTAKSPQERDAHIADNPIEKRMPEHIRKALAQADEDRKVLKALQEKDEIATFAKRAEGLGLLPAQGEILRKAYTGDATAIGELEKLLKGLAQARETGKLFGELGKSGGGVGDGTAAADMKAKADDYKKAQIALGKKCTDQMAFAKVYVDPANADLKKRYDAEQAKRAA